MSRGPQFSPLRQYFETVGKGVKALGPQQLGKEAGSQAGISGLLGTRCNWIAFPLVLFLCTRIALFGFSQIAMTLMPDLLWVTDPREYIKQYPFLDGLCRWDCWHYGRIARESYTEERWTNFFPLYPLLTRVLHEVTGIHTNLALLIVSNIACLGAFLVIYRIYTTVAEENTARWGLMLFAAYPFSFFQAMGYPESLMLFFSALAVLLALRGNHIWAGIALGFGTLGRHVALFTGPALVIAQLRQRGPHPKRLLLSPAILGLLFPWLFLGLYCLYQYLTFGNPLAFAQARDTWGPMAWWGIGDLLSTQDSNNDVRAMYSYLPFALITTVGAVALLKRQEWLELAAFAIVFMLILWAIGMFGLGRYTASCWPAFLPLGAWLATRPNWQGPIVGALVLFQGLFFYLHMHMFPIL